MTEGIAMASEMSPPERLASQEPAANSAFLTSEDRRAAETLVRHLFAHEGHRIDGLQYSVMYKLANGAQVGGDIVDVYHFDNGNVAFAIADISGKGAQAAVHAALVKFGLRCYASEGLTPERTVRSLDRVFLENNAFERTEQFASVFFAILDDTRRVLTYANAGHEPVLLIAPDGSYQVLGPTAPLVGVFDDQHHLFRQKALDVQPGSILFATTDGITEARTSEGEFFGMERFIETVIRNRKAPVASQIQLLLQEAEAFADYSFHDDIAVFAVEVS